MNAARMLFALVLVALLGCRSTKPTGQIAASDLKSELPARTPGSVVFKLQPLSSTTPGSQQWLASYSSQGKIARFRIELDNPYKKDNDAVQISIGKGQLASELGSDASAMIVDLQKALEAKNLPKNVPRESSVPFTYVNFGERQTRFSDDSFGPNPPGNWIPIKIFPETGDEESEVFLALDPSDGFGEFTIKDPDYGDAVLKKLAAVL
jgi:hypothetical protein